MSACGIVIFAIAVSSARIVFASAAACASLSPISSSERVDVIDVVGAALRPRGRSVPT